MDKKNVKLQQIIMTLLSIVFLVGVGYYGNKDKGGENEVIEPKTIAVTEEIIQPENEVTLEEEEEETEEVKVNVAPTVLVLNSKYHTYTKEYPAKVKMKYSTPVRESVEGKVVSLFIKEGQAIAEGQVIYEVEVGSLQISKKEKDKEQNEYKGLKKDLERAENRLQKLARRDSVAFVKQREVVEELRKSLVELSERINASDTKYSRHTVKSEYSGVVKNISVKVGDILAGNDKHNLFTIVGYDVFFEIPANDMVQWRQGITGQNTLVSSFETKEGQRIPIKVNLKNDTDIFFLDKSPQIMEGLKLNGEGIAENRVVISLVYKDVIEIPYSAINLTSEGKQLITIMDTNGVESKKEIIPIRKYTSYVLVSDSTLEGVSIQNRSN
ncbi:efflux RND transporter periplasmic adaptor subunit [Myroides odoratimimus]|uniref:efflux RND transporter periplasmic adaptor subunit n=1 Tax=Myroides odoratimimus TaxID=76832 RepID=UPI0031013A27